MKKKMKLKIVNRYIDEQNIILEPWCDIVTLKGNQSTNIVVDIEEIIDFEIEVNPDRSISIYLPEGSSYEFL